MVIKNSNAVLAIVAVAVVAYFAGTYFKFPSVDVNMSYGDIGKAKSYKSATAEEIDAAMELLSSNEDIQRTALLANALLSGRVDAMDSLAQASYAATDGIEELAGLHKQLEGTCFRTGNAKAAFGRYGEELLKVIDGKKSVSYEQAANNAFLAYSVLESNVRNCDAMVDQIATYLQKNDNEQLDALACAWVEFCAEEAVLTNSKSDYEKWEAVNAILRQNNQSAAALSNFSTPEQIKAQTAVMVFNKLQDHTAAVIWEHLSMPSFDTMHGGLNTNSKIPEGLKNHPEFFGSVGYSFFGNGAGLNIDEALQATILGHCVAPF